MLLETAVQTARRFYAQAPWKRLRADMPFALARPDGQMVYVVVRGGDDPGAHVFFDAQGLAGYAELMGARNRKEKEADIVSLSLSLDCAVCVMDEEPVFTRMRFAQPPRKADEGEMEWLAQAMEAATRLAERPWPAEGHIYEGRLGEEGEIEWKETELPTRMEMSLPTVRLRDELALTRLKKKPFSGASLSCAVRLLSVELEDEDGVPVVMVMLDNRNGLVGFPMVERYDECGTVFVMELLSYIEEHGRPERILTCDARTYCMLRDVAGQLGVPIEQSQALPAVGQALQDFMDYLDGKEE